MPAKDPAAAVKSAVDKTFQATVGGAQITRGRAQELVDEVSQAANKVRAVIDDLRVATGEDLRALQIQIDDLNARLAKLEGAGRAKAKPKTTAKKSPGR